MALFNGRLKFSTISRLLGLLMIGVLVLVAGCGDGKEIIKYKDRPSVVALVSPAANVFITINNPTFFWNLANDAVRYNLQVSPTSDFVNKTIDIQTTDTSYTTIDAIPNSTYYWRV